MNYVRIGKNCVNNSGNLTVILQSIDLKGRIICISGQNTPKKGNDVPGYCYKPGIRQIQCFNNELVITCYQGKKFKNHHILCFY